MINIVAAVIAAVFTLYIIVRPFTEKLLRSKREIALLKRTTTFAWLRVNQKNYHESKQSKYFNQ